MDHDHENRPPLKEETEPKELPPNFTFSIKRI